MRVVFKTNACVVGAAVGGFCEWLHIAWQQALTHTKKNTHTDTHTHTNTHVQPCEGDGYLYEHYAHEDRKSLWFDFIADTGDVS